MSCPEKCSGHSSPEHWNPDLVQMPTELKERLCGEKLLRCRYCGCVWYETRLYPFYQLSTVVVGEYDGMNSRDRFVARVLES